MNHDVFLANCIYHATIKIIPYQSLRNTQPGFSNLQIFGVKFYFKNTKTNQKNLDNTSHARIFLGYTVTMIVVCVLNNKNCKA